MYKGVVNDRNGVTLLMESWQGAWTITIEFTLSAGILLMFVKLSASIEND